MIPGIKGRGAVEPGRCESDCSRPRLRDPSGDFPRAQFALRHQGKLRTARNCDTFAPTRSCARARTQPFSGARAHGAAGARSGENPQNEQGGAASDRRPARWCRFDTIRSSVSVARTIACFPVRQIPRLCAGRRSCLDRPASVYDLERPPVRITTPHIPFAGRRHSEDLALRASTAKSQSAAARLQ